MSTTAIDEFTKVMGEFSHCVLDRIKKVADYREKLIGVLMDDDLAASQKIENIIKMQLKFRQELAEESGKFIELMHKVAEISQKHNSAQLTNACTEVMLPMNVAIEQIDGVGIIMRYEKSTDDEKIRKLRLLFI